MRFKLLTPNYLIYLNYSNQINVLNIKLQIRSFMGRLSPTMNAPKSNHAQASKKWRFQIPNCSLKLKTAELGPLGRLCVRLFASIEKIWRIRLSLSKTCRSRGLKLDADYRFEKHLEVSVQNFQKPPELQYSGSPRPKHF